MGVDQLGNCGSPIEIDEGFLVLTHGVGAVRTYSIGAALLDKNDPSRVLGRLASPLLAPTVEESSGYVPNIVYTCGALVRLASTAGGGVYLRACKNAGDLLDMKFGTKPRLAGWHHIKSYRKSMLAEIAVAFPKELAGTGRRKIRSARDIAWNCVFWAGYGLETGYAAEISHKAISAQYIGMNTKDERGSMDRAIERRPHLLCINNSTVPSAG
ncbi:MAG: hypothetical protein JWM57_3509, partial [Phycisphaerales bacterium]|nr:hypothetical protein [Phycisphaerales bacterium]